MALEDYIPNIFGTTNPQLAGLLSDEQAGQLQKQTNMAGLLGAAAALAQGMSPQGYRRSPLQNILTSLAAGYQNSNAGYQQGLQSIMQQQQLQSQMNKQQAYANIAKLYPQYADFFRVDPDGAMKLVAAQEEDKPIKSAFQTAGSTQMAAQPAMQPVPQPLPQQASATLSSEPQATPMPVNGQDQANESLPPVTVSPNNSVADPIANLKARKDYLMRVFQNLDGASSKRALDVRKQLGDEIKLIDEQIGRVGVGSIDVASALRELPKEFQARGDALLQMQPYLTPDQFSQRFEGLLKDAQLKTADIQEFQFAKAQGFKGSFQDWVQFAGRSRATNVSVGDLSKGTQGKVEEKALSAGDAITRLNDIQASYRPEYQDIRFRFGQGFASLKDKFNLLPPKDQQTLAAYSKYKQNTVQNMNQTIKDLTGASMGVDEAKRIISTLPNPGMDIFDGDSPTEFQSKLENAMSQTKYSLARQTYALRKGLKWENIPLDRMPSIINERGKQIAKEYKLDPSKPADKATIQRQLAAEFGIGY